MNATATTPCRTQWLWEIIYKSTDSAAHNSLSLFKIRQSDLKSAGKKEWQYRMNNLVVRFQLKIANWGGLKILLRWRFVWFSSSRRCNLHMWFLLYIYIFFFNDYPLQQCLQSHTYKVSLPSEYFWLVTAGLTVAKQMDDFSRTETTLFWTCP